MIFAAHCAEPYPSEKYWKAYVGSTLQSDMKKGNGHISKCTDLIIHENFTIETYNKDVALLRLEKELVFNYKF